MKKVLFTLAIALSASVLFGQQPKLQAIFIYNFTKHIEWPTNDRYNDFVIGVLGKSALEAELHQLASRKKIDNRDLVIKRFNAVSEIEDCHILFIPKGKADLLPDVEKAVKGQHTLIISEEEGAAQKGAGINFVLRNNRQKFELNHSNITSHGLNVSGYLRKLALPVE